MKPIDIFWWMVSTVALVVTVAGILYSLIGGQGDFILFVTGVLCVYIFLRQYQLERRNNLLLSVIKLQTAAIKIMDGEIKARQK